MNKSLWTATSNNTDIIQLKKDLDIDILIIGGGITGLSICYNLKNSTKNIALVEANKVGEGVTSKTTGKITYLQGTYYDIYKKYGLYTAKKYYQSQLEAINLLIKIINNNKIDCNLEKNASYLYASEANKINALKREFSILERIGCNDIEKVDKLPNKMNYPYIIKGGSSYTFHPLKYLYSLKKIINKDKTIIYENTRIITIDKINNCYVCKTKNNIIRAKSVVIATHYPYFLFPYIMPIKVTLEKSYVCAKKEKNLYFNALSKDNECTSIRYISFKDKSYKIVIYGSYNLSFHTNIKNNFYKLKNNINKAEYLWSNVDILTGDYMPLIGEIKDNLFLATGYNTWGMTNGTLAGKIIKDLIIKQDSSYKGLFNPNRKIISNYLKAISSSAKSYIIEGLFYKKDWYNNKIRFRKLNDKSIATYIDKNGKAHTVYRKCPHLNCSLLFNEQELTWDCPCHGSRFDIDGKVIEGPSNCDISVSDIK